MSATLAVARDLALTDEEKFWCLMTRSENPICNVLADGPITMNACKAGWFCQPESVTLATPDGDTTISLSRTEAKPCPAGHFCPPFSSEPRVCPVGFHCPEGTGVTCEEELLKYLCPEGFYCPSAGTEVPLECP